MNDDFCAMCGDSDLETPVFAIAALVVLAVIGLSLLVARIF